MSLTQTKESVKKVINVIDKSLKPDNKLSKIEMDNIDSMYDKVSTEE